VVAIADPHGMHESMLDERTLMLLVFIGAPALTDLVIGTAAGMSTGR